MPSGSLNDELSYHALMPCDIARELVGTGDHRRKGLGILESGSALVSTLSSLSLSSCTIAVLRVSEGEVDGLAHPKPDRRRIVFELTRRDG